MSTQSDPLIEAFRDALEDESRPQQDDDALIARAIAGATSRLAAAPAKASSSAATSSANVRALKLPRRPSSRIVRTVLPLAAVFAASVALASVYLTTHGTAVPPVSPSETPETPAPKVVEPPRGTTATSSPGEVPSISVDDLPSTKPSAAVTSLHVRVPPPPDVPVTAAELFRDANAERRSGNVDKAVDLYAALEKQFPASSETQASRVSLGRLLLDRQRDPKGALAQFDAYLSSRSTDSTLAEEARLGRALAFQRLGQPTAERAAWQDLLTEHPQSLHAARAKERLRALGGEMH
jgi:TolA-binding protein